MRHDLLLLACLPVLTACQSPGNQRIQSPANIEMAQGQSITLPDGGSLSYTGVRNDSRCRPDVRCIWEGDAEALFRWKPTTGPSTDIVLHTNAQFVTSARMGDWQLKLTALDWKSPPHAKVVLDLPK